MISIKMNIEVGENRHIELDLPKQVMPGKHEMIMIIDEAKNGTPKLHDLNEFAGSIRWPIDGLAFQKQMRQDW